MVKVFLVLKVFLMLVAMVGRPVLLTLSLWLFAFMVVGMIRLLIFLLSNLVVILASLLLKRLLGMINRFPRLSVSIRRWRRVIRVIILTRGLRRARGLVGPIGLRILVVSRILII